ncbi:phosphotransferase [Paenactinomyces guangxiensis]|uniref:Phosphotransferase n=1 Tax=Paenactinomyces guangxiensis TaxID=1490290 RepID=A0A7W1WTI8_9BACL|nr:phosphotransferase [Paenactinomyces guangxiensis]MBA4495772.1 phosphotransferase [Paenactinomyces guangxiensis]MBH8592761.1 phosphotransferase [Paenactinomyces guangxiensis]
MREPRQVQMEQILHTAVRNITPYRKHWCIETDEEKWIAKRTRFPLRLKWWIQVDQELRRRGFTRMPPIRSDGVHWMLTPFIEGKTVSYSQMDEVEKIVPVLAHFHRIGRGLRTPPEQGAAFLLYHRLHDRLVRFYQVMRKAPSLQGELGELLRIYGKDFYLDAVKAWEELKWLPLASLNHEQRYRRYLTHRDLASHNWIIDSQGKPWLIDFETADYDCQLGDVWQIASRILSENNWSEKWYSKIFLAYESVRPLSALEKRIIVILLSFPNEFFRESIGLVEKKKGYSIRHSLPYLQKLAAQRDRWRQQIKQISYW